MQHIAVEVIGKKKVVTVAQLRDLVRRNYVSSDAKLSIDGVDCRLDDVRDQLLNGATTLAPPVSSPKSAGKPAPSKRDRSRETGGADSPLFDPFADSNDEDFPPPPPFPRPRNNSNDVDSSSRRRSSKSDYKTKIIPIGIAVFILICAIAFLSTGEKSDRQALSARRAPSETAEENAPIGKQKEQASASEQADASDAPSFEFDKHAGSKTDKNDFFEFEEDSESVDFAGEKETLNANDDARERAGSKTDNNDFFEFEEDSGFVDFTSGEETLNANDDEGEREEEEEEEKPGEHTDFFEANLDLSDRWDGKNDANAASAQEDSVARRNPGTPPEIPANPPLQTVETSEGAEPLLVVDHEKIFADFFSKAAKKNKIPSTITINAPNELEPALANPGSKPRTIILEPSSVPYKLNSSAVVEGVVTIKGKSGAPSDATIAIVAETTPRSGAFVVSGGKLTLEGVALKRFGSSSDEYALVAVDARGEAVVADCEFASLDACGGRGVSVVGVGSSVKLNRVSFKGFADGVYAFGSSRADASNNCVFEECDSGATVADGAELNITDSTFRRDKIGVQVKADGSGVATKSSFEENEVPYVVDPYSERKFKITDNAGLD